MKIEWNYNVSEINRWEANIDGIFLSVRILPSGLFVPSVDLKSVGQGCETLFQAQGCALAYAKGKIGEKIRILQSIWDEL
jgi:hypothetical protein